MSTLISILAGVGALAVLFGVVGAVISSAAYHPEQTFVPWGAITCYGLALVLIAFGSMGWGYPE
jgi:hypothetical protein